MNYEEQRRQRLMTVLAAAVRIGRAGPLSDDTVGAELRDLADLYLAAAHVPYGYIGKEPYGFPVHNPDFKGLQVSEELRASILDQAAELVREQQRKRGEELNATAAECCPYSVGAPDDLDHIHVCDKADGHANGLGGSDHHCEWCGALFDEKGNSASPLGMAPLTRNRPDDELTEVEL